MTEFTKATLPEVLENLRVFVVLNAVTDGLETYPWSGLAGGDRTRRIEEYSVAGSSEAVAASCSIHIVPTADSIPGRSMRLSDSKESPSPLASNSRIPPGRARLSVG